ncbi:MAG: zinc ABC transporter substrate-binding protein [Bacilli bacterium]
MKKIIEGCMILVCIFSLSGCFKRDDLENIEIYTTVYPIEYITNRLYSEHSEIKSIYPDGINIDKFTLTDKQLVDYSKAGLYIFNGLSKEKDYVVPMINYNSNIKIIDTTLSMEYNYGMEELWLDPSNLLMIAKNIDTGFTEYIANYYLKDEIKTNYEKLKIELSELDAKIRLVAESSDSKIIIVSDDVFKFLEKYGFTVISLEENDNLKSKTINDVENLIINNQVNYIFNKKGSQNNKTVNYFVKNYNIKTIDLHPLSNISEMEREKKEDYMSIMNNNIELLKNELYN